MCSVNFLRCNFDNTGRQNLMELQTLGPDYTFPKVSDLIRDKNPNESDPILNQVFNPNQSERIRGRFFTVFHQTSYKTFFGLVRNDSYWLEHRYRNESE